MPNGTAAGDPVSITGYRIHRGEVHPAAHTPSPQDPLPSKLESHAALLASSDTNSYRDTSIAFDHSYVYIVRSVIQVEGVELESADSQAVTVTPRDIFPPAAPQDLDAALLPGSAPPAVLVGLSWSINLDTDLAAYRVYRIEQVGTVGEL